MTMVTRVAEAAVPARLGSSFRWLVGSSWLSNLGDGIILAAGPLLVASLTDDSRLVALAATVQWLPPLLFSLVAGVISDRVSRWRVLLVGNVLRMVVLSSLITLIVTDHVSIGLVLISLFLLGSAEVFVDNTAATLTPMVVPRKELATANSRIQTGFITMNELAGPPIGALLLVAGTAVPFGTQLLLVILSLGLLSRMQLPPLVRNEAPKRVHHDLLDGIRWTFRHAAVRTLVITIFVFNITFGAAWAVLVLYATEQLGLPEIGFGLITTASAIGGLGGVAAYGWLTRRISLSNLMRIGLIIETLVHFALALTTIPWVAMLVFVVFGAHAFIWGTTSVTIRQRVVPAHFQGRVTGVNSLGVFGGLVIGSVLGGLLAERWSVATPFWFAGVGSAIFVVLIWHQLRHIAHDDDLPEDEVAAEAAEAPEQ